MPPATARALCGSSVSARDSPPPPPRLHSLPRPPPPYVLHELIPPYEYPTPSDALVSQADTERRKHELLRAVQETRRGFAAEPDQRAAIEEAVVRTMPNRPLSNNSHSRNAAAFVTLCLV